MRASESEGVEECEEEEDEQFSFRVRGGGGGGEGKIVPELVALHSVLVGRSSV